MKKRNILLILTGIGFLGACAATAPRELLNARAAYQRASTGPAAELAPADLHMANQALGRAEKSFADDPDSYKTRDLAYVAERKSEVAMAKASIIIEKNNQRQAKSDFQDTQTEIITDTKMNLKDTRADLAASEQSGEVTSAQLLAEQNARAAADKRTAEAQAALARLGEVKEEARGVILTLSGSVLFASNRAVLLPSARSKLDQVADVLFTTRERTLMIEGHTDSQGSANYNFELSQRRAEAVRDYLVQRGYEADLIKAQGLGEGRPIADNKSVEGRANNRRVEIVIGRESHTSNQ